MKGYNRYTPQAKQECLSLQAKTESILLYASLGEKLKWLEHNALIAKDMKTQFINNIMISSSKKNFILHLIDLYVHRMESDSTPGFR